MFSFSTLHRLQCFHFYGGLLGCLNMKLLIDSIRIVVRGDCLVLGSGGDTSLAVKRSIISFPATLAPVMKTPVPKDEAVLVTLAL